MVTQLREALHLRRAIETGTFEGDGARALARIFPRVVSIELSPYCYDRATQRLRGHDTIDVVLGDSRQALPPLVQPDVPTLYFLDGHWSEGPDGADAQCPVMDELAAMRGGHPDDCVIIDDARFFLAAPPPPYEPGQWPRLLEVLDGLRESYPTHHITLLDDQIIAVPASAAAIVDAVGQRAAQSTIGTVRRRLLGDVLGPWSPTRRALRRGRRFAQEGVRRWAARPSRHHA
jgi:hypothetical protein